MKQLFLNQAKKYFVISQNGVASNASDLIDPTAI